MSSFVSQYTPLPIPRSTLFHSPPDTVPQTDELVQLQKELLEFKEKSIERAKKAGDDIRAIEESMRRLKEKEKGKMKAIQKAERERGRACFLLRHVPLYLPVYYVTLDYCSLPSRPTRSLTTRCAILRPKLHSNTPLIM